MSDDPFNRFTKAVVERLLEDTILSEMVTVKGKLTIGEASPPVKGRVPFIGIFHESTLPAIPDALTGYNRTNFSFECHAKSSSEVKRIAGRISSLLQGATNAQSGDLGDLLYFDFSNSEIKVDSCRQTKVEGPVQDVDLEVFVMSVSAASIWIDVVCSS